MGERKCCSSRSTGRGATDFSTKPTTGHRNKADPVSFKYDPFGPRIYKSSSSTTSVYAYDGDNLVEETNASGGIVAHYEQMQSIDELLPCRWSGLGHFAQLSFSKWGLYTQKLLKIVAGLRIQRALFIRCYFRLQALPHVRRKKSNELFQRWSMPPKNIPLNKNKP